MAYAVFSVEGTIVGNRTGEIEKRALIDALSPRADDKHNKWFFGVVQMQTREKTALRMIEIHLAEGFDMSRYEIGATVKIPVRISTSKNGRRILFREISAAELANNNELRKSFSSA